MPMDGAEQSNPSGARVKLGGAIFIAGFLAPLLVPVVVASELSPEWKSGLSGLLVLGVPELFMVVAVAVLGKAGFAYMKARIVGFIKEFGPPAEVSRTRYHIGLVMFTLPIVFAWLSPYVSDLIPGYDTHPLIFNLGGDLLLLTSLFVLGGDFWDKIQALFVYDAKAHPPAS